MQENNCFFHKGRPQFPIAKFVILILKPFYYQLYNIEQQVPLLHLNILIFANFIKMIADRCEGSIKIS